MTACPHGMPTPASCYECMEDGNFVPGQFPKTKPADEIDLDNLVVAYTFTSKCDGTCVLCSDPIIAGETIAKLADGPPRYAHDACIPGGATPAPWATRGGSS